MCAPDVGRVSTATASVAMATGVLPATMNVQEGPVPHAVATASAMTMELAPAPSDGRQLTAV